jgi:sugar lactone lactonase YvrE
MNAKFQYPSRLCSSLGLLALSSGMAAALPLAPAEPTLVPDSHGGYDFIEIDQSASRLLGAHTKNGTFDVFSLPDGKLEKQCKVGASQDSVVAPDGKYFISCSAKPRLVTIDAKSLEITGETSLPGPADILCYHPKNGLAYVGHDDAGEVWAVDVAAHKIVATIAVPEGPEGIVSDPESDRVYVNVRKTSEVIVIDTTTNKAVAHWSTAPATSPHGLAIDLAMHRLFAAGANGKLVEIDSVTGKVTGAVDIAPKVDQIAYDPELKRVFSASGNGIMSVVQAKADGLESLGEIPTHKGARSVAVDFKTHAVWTAYAEGEKSYILRLDPVR